MGVYIKGMEMPTSCSMCLLSKLSPTGESLICNYTLSTVPWDERPFDCPLIPIPPHGRLIDADGEVGVNVTMMPGGKCRVDFIAPTIIEEESET